MNSIFVALVTKIGKSLEVDRIMSSAKWFLGGESLTVFHSIRRVKSDPFSTWEFSIPFQPYLSFVGFSPNITCNGFSINVFAVFEQIDGF